MHKGGKDWLCYKTVSLVGDLETLRGPEGYFDGCITTTLAWRRLYLDMDGIRGEHEKRKKPTVTAWGGSAITKFASGLFKSWGRSMHASDPTPV